MDWLRRFGGVGERVADFFYLTAPPWPRSLFFLFASLFVAVVVFVVVVCADVLIPDLSFQRLNLLLV